MNLKVIATSLPGPWSRFWMCVCGEKHTHTHTRLNTAFQMKTAWGGPHSALSPAQRKLLLISDARHLRRGFLSCLWSINTPLASFRNLLAVLDWFALIVPRSAFFSSHLYLMTHRCGLLSWPASSLHNGLFCFSSRLGVNILYQFKECSAVINYCTRLHMDSKGILDSADLLLQPRYWIQKQIQAPETWLPAAAHLDC